MGYPRSHPELLSHYFFQLTVPAPDKSQSLPTPLRRGSATGRRGDSRRRPPLGTPPGGSGSGVFSKAFQLRGPASLQCSGLGWAVGGPVWVWRCGVLTGSQALGLQRGLRAGSSPPPPPTASAPPCPSLGCKAVQSSRNVSPGRVPETWGNIAGIFFSF